MRIMYDGINSDVPAIRKLKPAMVAGYLDGRYAWSTADWENWPARTVKVRIVINPLNNAGDVIDCETGDATPAQAAAWVNKRRASGYYRPTIYCNKDTIHAVRASTGSLILGKDYDIWVADWTYAIHQVTAPGPGNPVTLPATQFEPGQNFDTSIVYDDDWPHSGPPKPAYPLNQTGTVHSDTTGGNAKVVSHDGGKTWDFIGG